MIRLFLRQGLLGESVELAEIDREHCPTPRHLLDRAAAAGMSKSVPLQVSVGGRVLEEHELDLELQDGDQVIVAPITGAVVGAVIAYLAPYLITAAIGAAISYIAYLLSPRPKPPGVPQDRGDEGSQTYSWSGVKTNYGPGQPIPWGYGRHAVGGQVIWSDAEANRSQATGGVDDRLRVVLSLCEGPIHRIGDRLAVSTGSLGGFAPTTPPQPTFPAEVRVNGNLIPATSAPGARAWLRPGTQDQPPLPAPFAGVSIAYTPNGQLNGAGDSVVFTVEDSQPISSIGFVFTFPGGLYQQLPSGQLQGYQVQFVISMRPAGSNAGWSTIGLTNIGGTSAFVGYHASTYRIEFGVPGAPAVPTGPLEVQVFRVTGAGGTQVISGAILRDLVVVTPHTLRYPLEALLGLELQANERFEGGLPNITVRCDLAKVRVWDATNGWSPRCWDVPAAPFDFHTYPPGRNPAWCLLDFLLARWGLGRWLNEDQIDLPAFRAWAIFCDQDPNPADPWGEPQFTVDLVGDRPRPAWEWVLAFCAAGRAAPVMRGGKISVVYQYRDAHSDGTVTVPAKTPLQLITAGNCERVQVNWLSKANRPTVYQFQFLDETQAYTQDVLPVEDDDGTLNDPTALDRDEYRPEVVQAYGVTRASQLFREGRWRHRIQRLVRREISFVTGPWTLAAEVGDLIEFQHEMLRPFSTDVPVAMQVVGGGDDVTQLVVDHHLSGSGLQIVWRDPDGVPQRSAISSYVNGTDPQGRLVSVADLPAPVDCAIGTACVVGLVDKLTEVYQIVAITLQKDLRREVRALQWTPEAYDPLPLSAFATGAAEDDQAVDEPTVETLPPSVFGIRLMAQPDGSHSITWARPANRTATWARVYIRASSDELWQLVGSTELSEVPARGLLVGQSYQVSVCLESTQGSPVPPDLGDQATVVPEEFPRWQLPGLTNVRVTVIESGLLLQWDLLEQRDLAYFEVRAGSSWAAAPVIARERVARAVLLDPPAGVPLLVAARSTSGLYGPVSVVANPGWSPPGRVAQVDVDEFDPSPGGAMSGTTWNATDGVLDLASATLAGTYESDAIDAGYQAPFYWRVQIDRQELEDIAVGELDFEVGSGEARWRTVEGRPASPMAPGIDWQTLVSDLDQPIGDLPSTLLAGGHAGETGTHTQVLCETRFFANGGWGSWREHVDRVVVASQMQVRLTFNRRSLGYRARVKRLRFEALV